MSTTSSSSPSAEILTIGTELLLGETLDTNTGEIARRLRRIGLDVYRTSTVGDNLERIAAALRESLGRAQVVITTGGLGPTVDDPTREAAAAALGTDLQFDERLWAEIEERFARFGRTPTENNRRQAMLPRGAQPILNPVGTAPAFLAETTSSVLIALPGVPAEMRWLMENEVEPLLRRRLDLPATLHTRVLRAAGVGESWLDEQIRDLELGSDPTVGLMAHPGRIDIRLAAKAVDKTEAWRRIEPIELEIRRRLGQAIYGADGDTLEGVTTAAIAGRGWRLATMERGTGGALAAALEGREIWSGGLVLTAGAEAPTADRMQVWMEETGSESCLFAGLARTGPRAAIGVRWRSPEGALTWQGSYGGPPDYGPAWAVSAALDFVRRRLTSA